jgi:hypothetical protein
VSCSRAKHYQLSRESSQCLPNSSKVFVDQENLIGCVKYMLALSYETEVGMDSICMNKSSCCNLLLEPVNYNKRV